jgi:WD40 repeat protein
MNRNAWICAILWVIAACLWAFSFKVLWFKPSILPKHRFEEITHIREKSQNSNLTDLKPHAFSPDGKNLAIGKSDGTVTIKSLETFKEIVSLPGSNEAVVQTWFSPDGKSLAAAHRFGGFFLWNLETRKKISLPLDGSVRWLGFTADAKLLLLQDENWKKVLVWDLRAEKIRAILENPEPMHSLALFPNGLILAGVSKEVKEGANGKIISIGELILWNVATGKRQTSFPVDLGKSFYIAAIAPDNSHAILGRADGRGLIIWNIADGKKKAGPTFASVLNFVQYSRDGKTLITLGDELKTWNTSSWQEMSTVPAERGWSQSLSDDGHTMAVEDLMPRSEGFVGWFLFLLGADQTSYQMVRLWDLKSGNMIAQLPDASLPLFSPDGKTLATINRDGFVRLWDIPPRKNYLRAVGLWTLGLMPLAAGLCWYWFRAKRRPRAIV